MQILGLDASTITTVATAIGGIIAAIGTYKAGKRKQQQEQVTQQHSIEQDAAKALMDLNAANKAFRDEVREDLRKAQERIAVLETAVIAKDRIIMELQTEVQRLRMELEKVQNSQ